MQKLLSYIRHNRIKIIFIIVAIIFFYSLLLTANDAYKDQTKLDEENKQQFGDYQNAKITLTTKKCEDIIKEFLDYCTKGDYEKGYTYLSEECKKSKFPTFNSFKTYCENNVLKSKNYSISRNKSGYYYTYKISLNNKLSTGDSKSLNDVYYYKVVIQNEEDIKIEIE